MICSGEALTSQLERRFFSRFPAGAAPALYNLYGPTEAAVDVTAWQCASESPLAVVPIGRPVANTSVFVLDPHLEVVPIGIPGELYLGGVQLARGYLDRPDLTAEKFIPDPFADPENVGARLYRTGDQVRRLPGGEIVYLGRLDHQVKVRGFRIELGEVESVLSSLAGVREAVVIVREDTPGDLRLVAYVTGEAPVEALRQPLRERLPEFMVPAVFVQLTTLPLTPNGKVDRKAMPRPELGPATGFVAPRTPIEEILAEIWKELLGLERVGVHDNFFEVGGHSMLAVRLMAKIRAELGRELPISALFRLPTLEKIASALGRGALEENRVRVDLATGGPGRPLFLVHPIGGSVFCYSGLAQRIGADRPVFALQSPAPNGALDTLDTIEALAVRYLEEVRAVQPHGPYLLGGWSMGGVVALEMARRLTAAGEVIELLVLIDPSLPKAGVTGDESEEALVQRFAHDLAGINGLGVPPDSVDLSSTANRSALRDLFERARHAGLLPPDIDFRDVCVHFEVFRSNLRALGKYELGPWDGPAVVIAALRPTGSPLDPVPAWTRVLGERATVRLLEGDHYNLLQAPNVETVAEILRSCLGTVEASTSNPRAQP